MKESQILTADVGREKYERVFRISESRRMKDRRSLPVLKGRQAAVENATIPLKEKLTQVEDRKGDEKGR